MAETNARATRSNWNLPNVLTYGRRGGGAGRRRLSCSGRARTGRAGPRSAIFAAAAITDFFDGYLARAWSQQSSLGRMLDPIADKLLVAAVLLDADRRPHDRRGRRSGRRS